MMDGDRRAPRGSFASLLARDDGQSILEMAVAAPFLLLLLAGAFDVGQYFYDGIEIGNAARAGASYGASLYANKDQATQIVAAVTADAPEMKLQTTAPSDITSAAQTLPQTDPPTGFTVCACDSTPTNLGPCSGPSTPTCSASTDRLDTFVEVVVSHTFTPTIAFPGISPTLKISRTAIQEVSP